MSSLLTSTSAHAWDYLASYPQVTTACITILLVLTLALALGFRGQRKYLSMAFAVILANAHIIFGCESNTTFFINSAYLAVMSTMAMSPLRLPTDFLYCLLISLVVVGQYSGLTLPTPDVDMSSAILMASLCATTGSLFRNFYDWVSDRSTSMVSRMISLIATSAGFVLVSMANANVLQLDQLAVALPCLILFKNVFFFERIIFRWSRHHEMKATAAILANFFLLLALMVWMHPDASFDGIKEASKSLMCKCLPAEPRLDVELIPYPSRLAQMPEFDEYEPDTRLFFIKWWNPEAEVVKVTPNYTYITKFQQHITVHDIPCGEHLSATFGTLEFDPTRPSSYIDLSMKVWPYRHVILRNIERYGIFSTLMTFVSQVFGPRIILSLISSAIVASSIIYAILFLNRLCVSGYRSDQDTLEEMDTSDQDTVEEMCRDFFDSFYVSGYKSGGNFGEMCRKYPFVDFQDDLDVAVRSTALGDGLCLGGYIVLGSCRGLRKLCHSARDIASAALVLLPMALYFCLSTWKFCFIVLPSTLVGCAFFGQIFYSAELRAENVKLHDGIARHHTGIAALGATLDEESTKYHQLKAEKKSQEEAHDKAIKTQKEAHEETIKELESYKELIEIQEGEHIAAIDKMEADGIKACEDFKVERKNDRTAFYASRKQAQEEWDEIRKDSSDIQEHERLVEKVRSLEAELSTEKKERDEARRRWRGTVEQRDVSISKLEDKATRLTKDILDLKQAKKDADAQIQRLLDILYSKREGKSDGSDHHRDDDDSDDEPGDDGSNGGKRGIKRGSQDTKSADSPPAADSALGTGPVPDADSTPGAGSVPDEDSTPGAASVPGADSAAAPHADSLLNKQYLPVDEWDIYSGDSGDENPRPAVSAITSSASSSAANPSLSGIPEEPVAPEVVEPPAVIEPSSFEIAPVEERVEKSPVEAAPVAEPVSKPVEEAPAEAVLVDETPVVQEATNVEEVPDIEQVQAEAPLVVDGVPVETSVTQQAPNQEEEPDEVKGPDAEEPTCGNDSDLAAPSAARETSSNSVSADGNSVFASIRPREPVTFQQTLAESAPAQVLSNIFSSAAGIPSAPAPVSQNFSGPSASQSSNSLTAPNPSAPVPVSQNSSGSGASQSSNSTAAPGNSAPSGRKMIEAKGKIGKKDLRAGASQLFDFFAAPNPSAPAPPVQYNFGGAAVTQSSNFFGASNPFAPPPPIQYNFGGAGVTQSSNFFGAPNPFAPPPSVQYNFGGAGVSQSNNSFGAPANSAPSGRNIIKAKGKIGKENLGADVLQLSHSFAAPGNSVQAAVDQNSYGAGASQPSNFVFSGGDSGFASTTPANSFAAPPPIVEQASIQEEEPDVVMGLDVGEPADGNGFTSTTPTSSFAAPPSIVERAPYQEEEPDEVMADVEESMDGNGSGLAAPNNFGGAGVTQSSNFFGAPNPFAPSLPVQNNFGGAGVTQSNDSFGAPRNPATTQAPAATRNRAIDFTAEDVRDAIPATGITTSIIFTLFDIRSYSEEAQREFIQMVKSVAVMDPFTKLYTPKPAPTQAPAATANRAPDSTRALDFTVEDVRAAIPADGIAAGDLYNLFNIHLYSREAKEEFLAMMNLVAFPNQNKIFRLEPAPAPSPLSPPAVTGHFVPAPPRQPSNAFGPPAGNSAPPRAPAGTARKVIRLDLTKEQIYAAIPPEGITTGALQDRLNFGSYGKTAQNEFMRIVMLVGVQGQDQKWYPKPGGCPN